MLTIKSSIAESVKETFIYILFAIVTSLVVFLLAGGFINNYREMATTITSSKNIRKTQWKALHQDLIDRCDSLRPLSTLDVVISDLYSLCLNDTKYLESIQNYTCPLPIVILKDTNITYTRENPKKTIKITVKLNSQSNKGLKYFASMKEETGNFSIAEADILQWKDVDYLFEGKGKTLNIRLTSKPNKSKKKAEKSDGDLVGMQIIRLDELNSSFVEYMMGEEGVTVTIGVRLSSTHIMVTETVEILRLKHYASSCNN